MKLHTIEKLLSIISFCRYAFAILLGIFSIHLKNKFELTFPISLALGFCMVVQMLCILDLIERKLDDLLRKTKKKEKN